MDLSLKRKFSEEATDGLHPSKLRKCLDSIAELANTPLPGLVAKHMSISSTVKRQKSGRKVGRPRKNQLMDIRVHGADRMERDMALLPVLRVDDLDACSQVASTFSIHGCAWTKAVWFGSGLGIRFDLSHFQSIQKWLSRVMESFDNPHACQEIVCKLLWLCWHIWKAQNAHIFTHAPVDSRDVIVNTVRDDLDFVSAQALLVAPASDLRPAAGAARAWVASSPGSFRINCDVAIQPGATVGVAAAPLRNDQGKLVDGAASKVIISSVFQGEALAIRLACVLCDNL
ncbi:hypothetical protein LOK49_LG15G00603 [Camellia lanceoleosa]|uniref:Uncharacterized protein n=1 Tax=Camellia lanceoleosa TaxID=1840588 RepID=A0ACC0F286_9ERIC|nr:hypothetical protein LOK49_LG15G00603 [Camellia lanceoleosa]